MQTEDRTERENQCDLLQDKSDVPENLIISGRIEGENEPRNMKELADQLRQDKYKEIEGEHDEHVLENETLSLKMERILKENENMRSKLFSLTKGLEEFESNIDIPSNEEEVIELAKALKASQLLLQQKSFDLRNSEEMIRGLNIRLELEHDRRVRAQTEIGEIEKERMVIQNDLESTNMECVKRTEKNEVKLDIDYKISKYTLEIQKLESKSEKIILEKENRIFDLQSRNNELYLKVNVLEERYNNQVEVSTTLQNKLQSSYVETQSLIKEMEMLNHMFTELEKHIPSSEEKTVNDDSTSVEVSQNGKYINIAEVLQAAQSAELSPSLLQQSCYNEVTTKNGTKMVLSVSKTFLKLKDLILEKNTLVEQMTKMKHINETLCSHVNLHEEKLCGITDELNSTWFYVSKIKEQHKKLHSSEQILKAELAEKRQLLNNIRKELEESRTSWNLVKQKNAESEKQWLQLKADFAERKRILLSSSESGFSELSQEDKTIDSDTDSVQGCSAVGNTTANQYQEPSLIDNDNNESESEELPDPFSDDELEELDELKEDFSTLMLTSAANTILVDDKDECVDKDKEKEPGFLPIFVPSMSYLAQVPSSLQPEMLSSEKELELKTEPSRERVGENVLEEVDDNVRDLINRLSSSTARGAFLANRLSDIHRRIAHGASLTDHNDWFDNGTDEQETETDIDLNETESDDELTVPSPELESEIVDVVWPTGHFTSTELPTTSTEEDDFDDSRPASTDSMILAIDEAIQILDPISMGQIPLAPPQPTYLLLPPPIGMTVRPNFNQHIGDDSDDDDADNDTAASEQVPQQPSDSSTAVTRFLIKHLPKQLTQLRNEKHQLEDKIHDFEQIVSEQRMQMAEHERRVEVERSKTKKLEERLKQVEEGAVKS